METSKQLLIDTFGYDHPIFSFEIRDTFQVNHANHYYTIKRLVEDGFLYRATEGVYFIPKEDDFLSIEKIVRKKYIEDSGELFGYQTGINLANQLGLTTRTESMSTVVSNNAGSLKREVKFYNKPTLVKRAKTEVTKRNVKLLQVLDVLDEFNRFSEEPLEQAKEKLLDFIEEEAYSRAEVLVALRYYKGDARENAEKLGLL